MKDIFHSVKFAQKDPILGLNEKYNDDPRSSKVNLGVGIYFDDNGQIPLLESIHKIEIDYANLAISRGYLPIDGLTEYNLNTQKLLFGESSHLLKQNRVLTIQTLGGTGALKIGSDFLKQILPQSKVLISNPSWENHRALFERSGFLVESYPYYNSTTHSIDFEKMHDSLNKASAGTIVLLHVCCHNPTGVDPNIEQWKQIAKIIQENKLIPFLDMAYQGFSKNVESDSAVIRIFSDLDIPVFISSSYSKSFALYGERVGALTIVTNNENEQAKVLSQIKCIIRTNYSNPPTHGAMLVSKILSTPRLFSLWKKELEKMRNRIYTMRSLLVNKLENQGIKEFKFILKQKGMFSYSSLTSTQVNYLQSNYGIYIVSSGRICIAALNTHNIDNVANAIASVIDKK
ncbi:MAG: aspartate/tyrosine/aromatic aminotransferase [Bordetella sp.]|nr:MAG: aspartate/tyrosine/aromatic aminotransferase [Bordetella sp.]